jgi:hypothetical protein
VVNYDSNTITKLRASDLSVLQTISTGVNPIGITYDATRATFGWPSIRARYWFSPTGSVDKTPVDRP